MFKLVLKDVFCLIIAVAIGLHCLYMADLAYYSHKQISLVVGLLLGGLYSIYTAGLIVLIMIKGYKQ